MVAPLSPSETSALWLKRAQIEDTSDAWATAWMLSTQDQEEAALTGLFFSLYKEKDVVALDHLATTFPDWLSQIDPSGDILRMVDVYFLRFDATTTTGRERELLEHLSHASSPKRRGAIPYNSPDLWSCDPTGCTAADGRTYSSERAFQLIEGDEHLFAWSAGRIDELGAERSCQLPSHLHPFPSTFWQGALQLSHTGPAPGQSRLRLEDCSLSPHPDSSAFARSYINGSGRWDADGDGIDELVILGGPPHNYDVRLYNSADHLIDSLVVGDVSQFTIWKGQLVILTQPGHGNLEIFEEVLPLGAHLLRLVEGKLQVVQTLPGQFSRVFAEDFHGDGHESLLLLDANYDILLYSSLNEEPVKFGPVDDVSVLQLDDDPAYEIGLHRDGDTFILGGEGSLNVGTPPPSPQPPTDDPAIDRAFLLAKMGKQALAGQTMSRLALSREVAGEGRGAWMTVAKLETIAGHPKRAINAWNKAHNLGDPSALLLAINAALHEGFIDDPLLLTSPDLPTSARTALSSLVSSTFTSPPSEWSLRTPLASWNADQGALRVQTMGGAGVVARLELERVTEHVGFVAELQLDQLEFGGDLGLSLHSPGEEGVRVRIHAHGSRRKIHHSISPHPYQLSGPLDLTPFGPHRVEIRISITGEEGVFHLVEDGVERRETFTVALDEPLIFAIDARGHPGAMADLSLSSIQLWGVKLHPPVPLPPPDAEVLRALRNTQLRTTSAMAPVDPLDNEALDALQQTYGLTWRMHRSASRVGRRILEIPGLDSPRLYTTHPDLALLRADVLISQGRPEEALPILVGVEDPSRCVRRYSLWLSALQTLERDAEAAKIEAKLWACDATPARIRTSMWALGKPLDAPPSTQ